MFQCKPIRLSSSVFSIKNLNQRHFQIATARTAQVDLQTPPSDPLGTTGKVCDWARSIELKDIPKDIKTHTKYLILDGIACALVGAQLPWSRIATKALFKIEGGGNSTVFGWDQVSASCSMLFHVILAHGNQRTNLFDATLLNSTFIQGFELDDVHSDAPWHANSIILPALLAAAEHARQENVDAPIFDGKLFLLSTIVGFEVGSRVGHALHGSEMLSRGWCVISTSKFHVILVQH